MSKAYVDLHLHTEISRKTGDSVSWVSLRNALCQIRNVGIKAFAFTDHDQFSYSQYVQAIEIIKNMKMDLSIYPGVEITIARKNGSRGHILFIFDNCITNEQLENLELIINQVRVKSSSGAILSKVIKKLTTYKFFIIPHIDKTNSVLYEDLVEVKDYIFNVESKSNAPELKRFLKDSNNHKVNPIKFSD
jgi:hypothetical protein